MKQIVYEKIWHNFGSILAILFVIWQNFVNDWQNKP